MTRIGVLGLALQERPDRRAQLEAELRRTGLEHEVVVSRRPDDAGEFESTGVRGCYESHLAALRRLRDEGVDVAVVAEDDVWLTSRWSTAWPGVLRDLETLPNWSIVHLGYGMGLPPNHDPDVRLLGDACAELDAWELWGAHLYAVSGVVLAELVDHLEHGMHHGRAIPFDGALNEFRRARGERVVLARHCLAVQRPSPSSITPRGGWRALVARYLRPAYAVHRLLVRRRVERWAARGLTPSATFGSTATS